MFKYFQFLNPAYKSMQNCQNLYYLNKMDYSIRISLFKTKAQYNS